MKIAPQRYAESLLALAKGKTHQQIDTMIHEFVSFLARQGLLRTAGAVARSLRDVTSRLEGSVRVTITTASQPTANEKKMFEEMIHASYGKKSNISFTVDADLIGGFRVKAQDLVVDASDAGRLHALRRHLQKSAHA
ncbi:MAG: F0F1 ATP synthase subunit delta [Patescibacteria group bacterium]|mgnify:CR=1 FL=1